MSLTTENTRLLTGIGQVSMRARDLDRAVRFYRDILGLDFLFGPSGQLAFFDCQGIRLMLSVPESEEFDHPGSVLYFNVSNISEAYETLRSKGASFRAEPHLIAKLPDREVWMAFFDDSEGNLLALMSELKTGGA
ncbi:MAG: VOC family protein [Acidobacteria bacterium]|nr:MAG: VOC family protein [Acidobacteriota bacterium]